MRRPTVRDLIDSSEWCVPVNYNTNPESVINFMFGRRGEKKGCASTDAIYNNVHKSGGSVSARVGERVQDNDTIRSRNRYGWILCGRLAAEKGTGRYLTFKFFDHIL